MAVLETSINPRSKAFRQNANEMAALVDDLRLQVAKVSEGGGKSAMQRHLERGKLAPRERVRRLTDPGSAFLEFSQLAAYGMYENEAPSAGIITGVGRVMGRECVIICNDATVKGGTYYAMTVKKHLRAKRLRSRTTFPVSISLTAVEPTYQSKMKFFLTVSTLDEASETKRSCHLWASLKSLVLCGHVPQVAPMYLQCATSL